MNIIYKDAMTGVLELEDNSINCCITSPPYFQVRNYANNPLQIGLENTVDEYINSLYDIFKAMKNKLKDDGSIFVNLGDKYDKNKNLMLIPSRFAIKMQEDWILRNDIIWYKPNFQPSPVKDRLTNTYEHIFHFVKKKNYYYNLDEIRIQNLEYNNNNEKYYNNFLKKINNSDTLSIEEKNNAIKELDKLYAENKINKDSRLKIRGTSKILFGNDIKLSGRAREMFDKGFYFHYNNPKGKNPGDTMFVNIKSHKGSHEAIFPDDLIKPLIKMSTKKQDLILDIFAGTGTTLRVAEELNRRAIGFDINKYD